MHGHKSGVYFVYARHVAEGKGGVFFSSILEVVLHHLDRCEIQTYIIIFILIHIIILPPLDAVVVGASHAGFGVGSGQIWLTNIHCYGTEDRLLDCRRNPLGIHSCGHHLDSGVICNPSD